MILDSLERHRKVPICNISIEKLKSFIKTKHNFQNRRIFVVFCNTELYKFALEIYATAKLIS